MRTSLDESAIGVINILLGRALRLFEIRIFRLGLLKDGYVGIGDLPKREEIFVSGERPDSGGIGIRSLRGS
jgi:hypothetical protein